MKIMKKSDGLLVKMSSNVNPFILRISSQSTVGLRGLVNLKNTCYLNSIIQVLTHTPILCEFFLCKSKDIQCSEEHSGKPCLMSCVSDIFFKFYNSEKTALMIPELLMNLWLNAPHLAAADQQDAHEFFTAMLECLGRHFIAKHINSVIDSIFQGTFQSTVKCLSCGTESITKEPFRDISLEVFGDKQLTLTECLKRYTHVEELGPYHTIDCTTCGKRTESSKQLMLYKLPLILCMHFKRFISPTVNKWEQPIKFPVNLNLEQFTPNYDTGAKAKEKEHEKDANDNTTPTKVDCTVTEDSAELSEAAKQILLRQESFQENKYSLYAVVTHLGSSEGGHYLSYIRNCHDSWIECNDHIVRQTSVDEVLNCQAYMLFYHKDTIPYHRVKFF